jgi:Nuclease-related domain
MIYKELDPFDRAVADRFEMAGRKAEEQMAFYLRRYFASSADVDVLNHVRIELEGEFAQMDHLLLAPHGLLIVESKSVSGEIVIGDSGQWVRRWQGGERGMPSPITQARMQGMLLKDLLIRGVKESQRERMQRGLSVDVLVAISDAGVIRWPSTGPLPEVCKADQVPERVLARVQQCMSEQAGQPQIWNENNRRVVAEFLMRKHRPLVARSAPERPAAPAPAPARPSPKVIVAESRAPYAVPAANAVLERKPTDALPARACRKCKSYDVSAEYGRYGYYLKCKACEGNSPLKFKCPACGQDGKIRKSGRQIFAECTSCTASELFFTNP